jgi:hypothetical protein
MPRDSVAGIAQQSVSAEADSSPAKNAGFSPPNAPSALRRGSSGLTFFTPASDVRNGMGPIPQDLFRFFLKNRKGVLLLWRAGESVLTCSTSERPKIQRLIRSMNLEVLVVVRRRRKVKCRVGLSHGPFQEALNRTLPCSKDKHLCPRRRSAEERMQTCPLLPH